MKYSLRQLKRYLPTIDSIQIKDLVDKIWQSVAEVESIEYLEEKFRGIVVGKLVEVEKHPKSEKLLVTKVDIGAGKLMTIVTGAKNISVGDFVPYISVGASVPTFLDETGKPLVIANRNMVGIVSEGMLASEKELGVSDDHNGIMILRQEELREELIPGVDIAKVLEWDDVIIEIENKTLTHRGDCFSAVGLAREIATLYSLELVEPEWQQPSFSIANLFGDAFEKDMPTLLKVEVPATDSVDRYTAIVLDAVQVKPSPLWLRLFLKKHDINAVNNVVDITNYVMLDYGQPMHAFDAASLSHKKRDGKLEYSVIVRHAKAGEKLVTLDGKERTLPTIATVIADAKQPLAIAGIIGGQESGIKETSTRIILESAVFDKYAIRNTSMSIGAVTDASVVFSRKQDAEKTGRALLRAVHLLSEMTGAVIDSTIADVIVNPTPKTTIVVSHERIERFIGISVSPTRVVQLLELLGFEVSKKTGMYSILVPSWRPDVGIDEDIYEEIARLIGYKEITPELPTRGVFAVKLAFDEQVKQKTIQNLNALGLSQAMNFSFVSKALYEQCQLSLTNLRSVINAISPDVQYMRKQIIPGLMQQLAKNQYTTASFGLFEMGKTSRKGESYLSISDVPAYAPLPKYGVDELGLPIEDEHLAMGIISDSSQPAFFILKSYFSQYLKSLGIENTVSFVHPDDLSKKLQKTLAPWLVELFSFFKKGRVAVLVSNSTEVIGILGEPNTLSLKSFGIAKESALLEVSMAKVSMKAKLQPTYKEPSKYPSIVEDYCFEVPFALPFASIQQIYDEYKENALKKGITLTITPQDIYSKSEKTKQVTHRVSYSDSEKQITEVSVRDLKSSLFEAIKSIGGKQL